MEVKEGKGMFAIWFKGLKSYTPEEIIENKYNFTEFWAKFLVDNAHRIGKKKKK